jgi:hypothetical protein
MKRLPVFILMIVFSISISTTAMAAKRHEDYRVIKRAVKKKSHTKHPFKVKWFRLQVRDLRDRHDKIRLTLPLSLIEGLLYCSDEKDLRFDCDGYEFHIREWFDDLKKAGPMSIIEIHDDDILIRIWLE